MIYLDNAATSGRKPPQVINAVMRGMRDFSANPGRSGHALSEKAAIALFGAREKLSGFFGADDPAAVCFTLNCTHALNCVIKGLLKPGDHCVVSSLEHNAVMRPLKKSGAAYDTAEVSFYNDALTVSAFESLIRPDTRLVICTGASNVFGKKLPIAEIGALCRSRGVPFAVDAAQLAGIFEINMRNMNIDYLCIAPHKGLYAPMGTGLLIALAPIPDTLIEGGTGTESLSLDQPSELPERIESGTVNLPGILGMAAGVDFVSGIGIDKIYRHEMELISLLYSSLMRLDRAVLYTPDPVSCDYAPVLSFNIEGVPSEKTAAILSRASIAVRAGLHCAPCAHRQAGTIDNGTVRVCPGVFSSKKDIYALLNVVEKIKN